MANLKKALAIIMISSIIFTGCGKVDSQNINSKNSSDTTTNSSSENPQDKTSEATEKPITKVKITPNKPYNDNNYIIKFMGLKEYKKFKSDKYKDTPQKGNKYLVLFLECKNATEEKLYINPDNLSAALDGKEITHSVIFNEPEGYTTFFKNFEPLTTEYGFIVWEVPENWEKIDIIYTGLEYETQNRIKMSFTKNDLQDPPLYEDVVPR